MLKNPYMHKQTQNCETLIKSIAKYDEWIDLKGNNVHEEWFKEDITSKLRNIQPRSMYDRA